MSPTPIPSVGAFVAAISAALNSGAGAALRAPSHGADLYEAYLMALVLRAACDIGMQVSIEDVNGSAQAKLRLRTSPTPISFGSFTHAVLSGPGEGREPLEVHTGIYVRGTSGARHECDVVVIKRDAGVKSRSQSEDPPSSAVVWAMEAKFYVTSNVGLAKAREYFGLNLEMSGKSSRRTALVVTQSTPSVARVFAHHTPAGHFYERVYPGELAVEDLRAHVRQVLRRRIA